MTSSRLAFGAAGGVVLVLLVQAAISTIAGLLLETFDVQAIGSGFWVGAITQTVLPILAFGVGLWIALRFVSVPAAEDSWRSVVRRGFVATGFGALGFLIYEILLVLVQNVTITRYPLVNPLDPQLNTSSLTFQLLDALLSTVRAAVECVPLLVLAVFVIRARLAVYPEPATDRASDAESLSAR